MMEQNNKGAASSDLFPWELLFRLAEYRSPKPVTENLLLRSYSSDQAYYYCPRCDVTLEREFQTCCDRCGQLLDWKGYRKAKRRR